MYKFEDNSKGFTLVELIVSVGLFAIVATVGIGSIASIYNSNSKSQSLTSVTNDLNYTIESMSRNIRFAKVYHCGNTGVMTVEQSCNSGDTFLSISTTSAYFVTYEFVNGGLFLRENYSFVTNRITSRNVTIEYARFYVLNTAPFSASPNPGYDLQPYVVLVIKGYSGNRPSNETRFTIQTTVSKRQLDL
jgi:prepilin-type N-terminal cleavage/methylation domain-containing protein